MPSIAPLVVVTSVAAGTRAPRFTSSTAALTRPPIAINNSGSGRRAATHAPAGTVHADATTRGTIAVSRTLRRPPASPAKLMAPAARLASTTPSAGPRTSTSAGTATSANPIPVSHCTDAPNKTMPPSKRSAAQLLVTDGSLRGSSRLIPHSFPSVRPQ